MFVQGYAYHVVNPGSEEGLDRRSEVECQHTSAQGTHRSGSESRMGVFLPLLLRSLQLLLLPAIAKTIWRDAIADTAAHLLRSQADWISPHHVGAVASAHAKAEACEGAMK